MKPPYLPDKKNISSGDPSEDPLRFYYRPFTKYFYKKRLEMAVQMLGPAPVHSLLEVGYGSGIFLPELSQHCRRLCAIDVHDEGSRVQDMLAREGVRAELFQNDPGKNLPFADHTFDAIVSISTLEHLEDPSVLVKEFMRILKDTGFAVVGFPTQNPFLHLFFKSVGFDYQHHHLSGPRRIFQQVKTYSSIVNELHFPAIGPALYHVLRIVRPR